jgi:hypothetical protein
MHATIVDRTGLVMGCTKPDRPMFNWDLSDGLRIGNPGGDLHSLQIEWEGDPCMADREYMLLESGDGYVLEGRDTFGGRYCIMPRVIHVIRLSLSEAVDASMVGFAWNVALPPTPTPSPMAPGTQTLACGSDADGSAIEFIDHSGLVASCTTRQPADSLVLPPDGPAIVTNFADQEHLVVTWPKGSACSMGPADLEFWGPLTHADPNQDQYLPNYVLRVDRRDISSCSGSAKAQSVELVLSGPVFASDVEGFVSEISELGGGNFTVLKTATSVGSFDLAFGGGNVDWVAGEPIDISALLTYEGPDDKVSLAGMVYPEFGFEQLDGTLEVRPDGIIHSCPHTLPVLKRNVGQYSDFRVSEGIGNEQYTQYFDQYGYDDQFRLPAGTYRLYAIVSAQINGCGGEPLNLSASVVIHVR